MARSYTYGPLDDPDKIAAIVRRELRQAQGYDSDVLATKREAALHYYTGDTKSFQLPQAEAGRSNIVSADVRDVHGAILSQIVHCFKTSMIEFEPESEEDEEQAQLETDVVALQIQRNGGDKIFYECAHDALLSGMGWAKVWVEEQEHVARETYQGIFDSVAMDAVLTEDPSTTVEVTSYEEETGELKVKKTFTSHQLKIESIDPANILFSPAHSQYDLQELRFLAERKLYTIAELMDMGLTRDECMSISSHRDDHMPAVVARDSVTGTGGESYYESSDVEYGGMQDATTLKECYHCYVQLDMEDNGSYERYHVLIGGHDGSHIIDVELHEHIPFVAGSPLPMPHRVEGQGLYELLKEVQDAKSVTLRHYLDNLSVMNASRLGVVDGQVNMDDLTNGRINGIVRMKREGSIMPLPATDVGAQAITGLEYLDKIRTQRGGAALDLNNSDMQVAQSSAAAAIGEYTAKEKMSTLFARNMVNTLLKGTFLLVHHCMRAYMSGEMGAKVRGKWRKTDPGQWPTRSHVQTLVGLNSQERKEKLAGLQNLLQIQLGLLQSGAEGVIVSKSNIYNALADLTRAGELGLPEQYWVDPESKEGQQAQQMIAQNTAQAAQQQQQMAALDMRLRAAEQQLKEREHEDEIRWKYYDTNVDAGLAEAKMTTDNIVKMEQIDATERAAKRTAEAGAPGASANRKKGD